MTASYDVVVPSAGRASLGRLLTALATGEGPPPGRVIVVDDRRRSRAGPLLAEPPPPALAGRVEVLPGPGAGPAAARNVGWRAARGEWVAFLDDDVEPTPGWRADLAADLDATGPDVAGSQGRIEVPRPRGRRPTDWERDVAGLETARWATADLAYRRAALVAVGGFDERFARAYREDADLGLRIVAAGWRIVTGRRRSRHPVAPAGPLVSVRRQAGNADDALMGVLHGSGWRAAAGAPAGRRPRHVAVTLAGLTAIAAPRVRRPAAAAWLAGTFELAAARIAPGPRTPAEVATMLATSLVIPPAATGWWLVGRARARRLRARRRRPPDAVLFDRDGTLIADVPYNGDPSRVRAMPGARVALDRLRAAGVPVGVVSNQSGVARGLLSAAQVEAVNRRVEEVLGPLGPWAVCPHGPDDGCGCRKPAPGLVREAAARLGVEPARCALVGDIGADVEAAAAAGARGVLVPTSRTRPEEVAAAAETARDLPRAVDLLLGGGR